MKKTLALTVAIAAAMAVSAPAAVVAQDAAPAAAAADKNFTVNSSLTELLADAEAKAVLAKHLPDVVEQIEPYEDQIPPEFTLEALADYGLDISDEQLAAIDADLKAL